MPPALTTQGGGMDPVNGQLLANLPDLGVEEEGWVNDGLLSRNPHLGVLHLHIHGLGLIHLLENTHTHGHTHIACQSLQKCLGSTQNMRPAFALSSPGPSSSYSLIVLSITFLSAERATTS